MATPRAGHAQHMTAHIFMALGMWDAVVAANEAAGQVVAAELRANGSIVRPRLGAEFDDVTAVVAMLRGRATTQGALVAIVRRGSLAERMGLRVDDIVVAMNERPIMRSADLARALLAWRQVAGTRLVVLRGGVVLTLTLD